jgi:ABC-type branched-subunit amino acid transport system ATPase component/ABC-type branched-subunit amino acid transport system permease subunit
VEPLQFALLGLGAGAMYALTAQGLVLIYRASGVVNFAQCAVGMICAFLFFVLHGSDGLSVPLAMAVSLTLAAVVGLAIHVFVMRPLRHATPLARLMSTLAVMSLLLVLAENTSQSGIRAVGPILPLGNMHVFGTVALDNRLILLAIAVGVTVALSAIYRYTRFGLATSAVSENTLSAGALGISPNLISATNWAIASILATLGAILIASVNGVFSAGALTLLIIPTLAAALIANFTSFPLALIGGLVIGIVQSEMALYISTPGWTTAAPFLLIIVVLVVRGRPLPIRGEITDRAAALGHGVIRVKVIVPVLALALLTTWLASPNWVAAITTSVLGMIVILSVVVLAGYAGQLSLAQYTLAGMGAWASSRLVAVYGLPFLVAALVGIAVAVGIGLFVGLVALRSRGVNLAIATVGIGIALEQVILLNRAFTGGNLGTTVGGLEIFGLHFDTLNHPKSFATLVILALVVLVLIVANLRRSVAGRRLVAMRGNERAAASLGVGVFGAKLFAFALSSAIAAVGGILLAFSNPIVVFTPFTLLNSIGVVLQAVIGGLGYIVGAIFGGVFQVGGVLQYELSNLLPGGDATFVIALLTAVVALTTIITVPNGAAAYWGEILRRRFKRRQVRPSAPTAVSSERSSLEPVVPKRLEVHGVSVNFGGVRAVRDVSLSVDPGEILGLVGPNGSGKTTLIDAITGFVKTSSGSVLLGGRTLDHRSPVQRARRGIGRTFQTLELFPGMTVADNLRVASDSHGMLAYFVGLIAPGSPGLSPTAGGAALALELENDLDRTPEELPFGRRRLVAIARAVAARPSVLLLDEPAAGLSVDETAELGAFLRRLAVDLGLAIILVEHDLGMVTEVSDRIVVLEQGSVIGEGDPLTVLAEQRVVDAYMGVDEASGSVVEPPEAELGVIRNDEVPSTKVSQGATGTSNTAREPVMATRDLDAGYGDLAAVRNLNIEVAPGEVLALLGPNGAGKTTTLLTLAGVLAPLRGEVLWRGEPIHDPLYRRVARGIGLVTEERSVFFGLTTEANLRLGRGDPKVALQLFPELVPLKRRKAGLLSGGEQQMLSLARVLAAEPAVLLVDELSLGLAPIVVSRLYRALRETASRGTAVILVEQHVHRALEVADRVCVLNRGSVVLESAAEPLRDDPELLRRSYLVSPVAADG